MLPAIAAYLVDIGNILKNNESPGLKKDRGFLILNLVKTEENIIWKH